MDKDLSSARPLRICWQLPGRPCPLPGGLVPAAPTALTAALTAALPVAAAAAAALSTTLSTTLATAPASAAGATAHRPLAHGTGSVSSWHGFLLFNCPVSGLFSFSMG